MLNNDFGTNYATSGPGHHSFFTAQVNGEEKLIIAYHAHRSPLDNSRVLRFDEVKWVTVEDIDGDDKITPDGDRKIIGYKDPSYRFSIANTFTYKNFTLRVFINSIQGGKNRYMAANTPNVGYNDAATNCNAFAYDYWTPANPDAEYAQLYYATPTVTTVYRQRSFVRLQDVSLSYRFNRELLSKIGLRDLKLYVSGKNLYTWTNWQGWDPETGQGLTLGGSPVLRSWTFGVEIGF